MAFAVQIDVTAESCVPSRKLSGKSGRCDGCGVSAHKGIEEHRFLDRLGAGGKANRVMLCPVCHTCMHLDDAGARRAGKIVWLPELSQGELNAMCIAIFSSIRQAKPLRERAEKQGRRQVEELDDMLDQMRALYRDIEHTRTRQVIAHFGDRTAVFDPVDPSFIAQQVARIRMTLPWSEYQTKIDGLRLLPAPKPFSDFIQEVGAGLIGARGPFEWLSEGVRLLKWEGAQ